MKQKAAELKKRFIIWYKELIHDLRKKIIAFLAFTFSGFLIWALFELIYYLYGFSIIEWIKSIPYVYQIFQHFFSHISMQTNLGIFYIFLFASLFVFPIPLEALYFSYLIAGYSPATIFMLSYFGILSGQIINYSLGRFFGFIFVYFIKKKTRNKVKGWLKRYGIVTLIPIHVVPFPFQAINFIIGLIKYNFLKWILSVSLGLLVKQLIMNLIYIKGF